MLTVRQWDAKDGSHGEVYELVDPRSPSQPLRIDLRDWAKAHRGVPVATGDTLAVELAGTEVREVDVLAAGPAAGVPATTPWLVLMCKVPDVDSDWAVADFQGWFGPAVSPGPYTLGKYWNTISYGQLSLGETHVVDWVTMPHEADYYRAAGKGWPDLVYDDCTAAADTQVDFNDYYGVQMYAGMTGLDSAWGTSLHVGPARDGRTEAPAVWIPSDWLSDGLRFIAHEMGHAYGWMHSGPREAQGDGDYASVYDVMSAGQGVEYPSGLNTYHLPVETIAANKVAAGWIPAARVATYAGGTRTITLQGIESPPSTGFLMATIPTSNPAEYYTLEARRKVGYDGNLPGEGIIVHLLGGARPLFYDADHDYDTTDTEARIDVGETLVLPNGVSVAVTARDGAGFTVRLEDKAPPVVTQYALVPTPRYAVTRSIMVGVNLAATDISGVKATYLSENPAAPDAAAAGWRPGLPKSFVLSHGYGRKVVYAWVKDRMGNVSARLKSAIVLDEPPTARLRAQKVARTLTIPIVAEGIDDHGVVKWRVSDRPRDGRWARTKPTSFTFQRGPDGVRTIYLQVADRLGASKFVSVSVTLDLPGQ